MELRIWSAAIMVVALSFLYECKGTGMIKTKNGTPARPNHKFITSRDLFLERQNNRTTYVKHKRSQRNHRSRAEKRKKREPFKFSDETDTIRVGHHKQRITSGSQSGSFIAGGSSNLRLPVQKSQQFQNNAFKRKGKISDHSYGRKSLKRRDQQGSEEAEDGLNRRSRNRVKLKLQLPHSEQVKKHLEKKNESLAPGVVTGSKRQRISGGFFQAPNEINGAQEMVPEQGIRLAGDTNGFSLTEMSERPKHGLNPPHIFSPAVHKYMPVEHRYDGGPIHRYLNSPVVFRGDNRQSFPFMPGPMTGPFGGEGLTPMFEGPPRRGQRIIIVNRPVKTPFPVPVHGPPRVVLVHHPVPLPPQRVPVPVVVQHQRRPPIVIVHHKEYAGPVIDPCGVNPCRNGGTCSAIGSEFRCICPVGYKSERCEAQSKCSPNPCKNFGKCTELPDDYECTCHTGFHGKSCDLESKCEPNPCRNGGVCTENLEAYICSCSRGFMGKNCEQESKCLPVNPCKNGGICTEGIDGYKCNCRDGFSGINCEVRDSRSPCDSNPCHNGATCIVDLYDSTKFSCYCAPGFTGFDCLDVACTNCPSPGQCVEGVCVMDYINSAAKSPFLLTLRNSPCGSINPCLFGGHCVPNGAEYSCLCPDGRSGLHCEHLFQESSCDGCHRHAVCIASKCTCRQGYTGDGKTCQPKTSHCHPNPCENGGSCHEDENAGTNDPEWWCECTKGYSGPHCHEYDPCANYKCHNGGRCEAVNFEPHCKCEAPWEGPTCQYDNFCLPRDGVNRNPCKNGGKCEFVNNEVSCVCPVQYEGQRCEVNKCDKCDKNAFCEKGICKCKPPYSGDGIDCELENAAPPIESHTAPNFCDSNPCQNGATCVDGKNTFYCACRQDTFGRLCEKTSSFKPTTPPPKAVCHPNPCLNGGLCKETGVNQDFDCLCPNARYKGRFCDVDMCAECDPHARCINGKCFCRKGFLGDGYSCKKVKRKCNCPSNASCIGGSACICNPGYYMNTSGKRACIPIVQSLPVSPTVKQGTKSVSSVLDADPTSRAKQWSEDIIVTEYRNVGCWSDTTEWRDPSKRAMMVMEGLDPLLSGDYRTRHQPISKCADVAKRLGFRVFAIQNGGQCFGGSDDTSYKRYGPSEKCLNGVGGPIANDVYKL